MGKQATGEKIRGTEGTGRDWEQRRNEGFKKKIKEAEWVWERSGRAEERRGKALIKAS